jgi:hypothetical protein
MHTLESRILYSEEALRGADSGQHPTYFRKLLYPEVHGAIRFLLWWLFLHRRLRAGNEAQVRRRERRSTRSADHFRGALLVFIRVTGKVFRPFPQAFRLRPWRPSSGFPLLATLEQCVTTSVPSPGAGQNARKQSRLCNGFYTR